MTRKEFLFVFLILMLQLPSESKEQALRNRHSQGDKEASRFKFLEQGRATFFGFRAEID